MKYILQSTFDEVHNFESLLEKKMREMNLSKRSLFNIRLAFHEAIINVIQHTYKFSQDEKIIVDFDLNNNFFECTIEDFGKPVDPETITPKKRNEIQINGLGIFLYSKLMDEIEFSNTESGNKLKMKKYFNNNDFNNEN